MAAIDELTEDFLSQKIIAVANPSPKDPASSRIYRTLLKKGYTTYALNPDLDTFDDKPVYPDLKSMPEKPEAVVLATDQDRTLEIVKECVELGIGRVWMHSARGVQKKFGHKKPPAMSSVNEEAVALCRENNITVIPGACPMMFIGDIGHKCIGFVLRLFGAFEVSK